VLLNDLATVKDTNEKFVLAHMPAIDFNIIYDSVSQIKLFIDFKCIWVSDGIAGRLLMLIGVDC
jgi:hypothetical protein